MILFVIVVSVFLYSFIGVLAVKFCVQEGIGVEKYSYMKDDITGAVFIGIFWVITAVPLLSYFAANYVWKNWGSK